MKTGLLCYMAALHFAGQYITNGKYQWDGIQIQSSLTNQVLDHALTLVDNHQIIITIIIIFMQGKHISD